MNLKSDIRATDPIFEAMRNWMKDHPGVNMQMEYDNVDISIKFRMERVADGACVTRSIPFHAYDITTLTPEKLTRDELEAMWIELGKEDKDE